MYVYAASIQVPCASGNISFHFLSCAPALLGAVGLRALGPSMRKLPSKLAIWISTLRVCAPGPANYAPCEVKGSAGLGTFFTCASIAMTEGGSEDASVV